MPRTASEPLVPLPEQPDGVPWPVPGWPDAEPPRGTDVERLGRLLDAGFDRPEQFGLTQALLVVHGGSIVAERYGEGVGPDTTLLSWSMAKSITHACIGILVREGLLDCDAAARVAAWPPDDPRAAITLEQLLRMTSGLHFVEDYVDERISDVIEMLFGSGADDVAGFAAAFPLDHEPGTFFNYSSGTSNIVARIAGEAVGGGADELERWMRAELFDPIGMHSAVPRFDAAGTFVGSSYVYATARDFARFGLLYLRGGVWDSHRLLPAGWVDHARTPTTSELPPGETRRYGAHWWLWDDGLGTFGAHGYEGQRVMLVPALDLIVVRLGKTPADHYDDLDDLLREIVDCFRGVSGRFGASVAFLLEEEVAMTDDDTISDFTPLSRERAEQIVRRLVAEGRLAQERAEDRVEELIATSRARGEQFSAAVQREVTDQVAALRAQIAELEAKVSEALRQTRQSLRRASATSAAAARKVAKKARSKVPAKRRKKKAPAKRTPARKRPAKKAPAKKAPAKKRTPAKRTTSTKKRAPAKRATSTRSTTKKATKKKAPAKRG